MQGHGHLAESLAVDFHHGLAELAELVGELEFGRADLVGRFRARFLQRVLEDLLVLVGQLRPDVRQPTIVTSDSVTWPVSMMCD